MGVAKRRGLSSIDRLIGDTPVARNLTLATRNILDFDGFDIQFYNPWTSTHPATIYSSTQLVSELGQMIIPSCSYFLLSQGS